MSWDGALLIILLCAVTVMGLVIAGLRTQVKAWREECLAMRQRVSDDAVELLRLRSLVRAMDDPQGMRRRDTFPVVGYDKHGKPLYGVPPHQVYTIGVDVQKDGAVFTPEALPGG